MPTSHSTCFAFQMRIVISAEAAVLTQPCECPLNHPPPWQHTAEDFCPWRQPLPAEPDCFNLGEITVWNPLATRMWRMLNDLHSPAEVLLDPGLAATCVALIHP